MCFPKECVVVQCVHYGLTDIVSQDQYLLKQPSPDPVRNCQKPQKTHSLPIPNQSWRDGSQTQLSKLRIQPSCHQMEVFGDSAPPHHHPVVNFIGAFLIVMMTGECYQT